MENLDKLINELRHLPNETPWLEFKCNNYTPDTIGENISALANGAALYEKNFAYMIWGINDTTHEIVGADYDLQTLKKGNQEIQSWLRNMLSLNADFEFYSVQINEKKSRDIDYTCSIKYSCHISKKCIYESRKLY